MRKGYSILLLLIVVQFINSCNSDSTEIIDEVQNIENNGPDPTEEVEVENEEETEEDITPPTITLNANSLLFNSSGALILTANADDENGISKIEIYQENTLLNSVTNSTAVTNLNLTHANNGELHFTAIAFDNANPVNSSTSIILTVQIDIEIDVISCGDGITGSNIKRFNEITDGAGRVREVEIETSAAYQDGEPAPIVIVFHGHSGNIDVSRTFGFINAINESNDAGIVVIPQSYGVGWDQAMNGTDLPFFDNILEYVSEHYCADLSRVFVTGFSWGADMTNNLSCFRGDNIRGVANYSGGWLNFSENNCSTTNYPAATFSYGTIAGDGGDGSYSLAEFNGVTDFYHRALGSGSSSSDTQAGQCTEFLSGSQPLVICEYPTMGHNSPSINEARNAWEFWKSLP